MQSSEFRFCLGFLQVRCITSFRLKLHGGSARVICHGRGTGLDSPLWLTVNRKCCCFVVEFVDMFCLRRFAVYVCWKMAFELSWRINHAEFHYSKKAIIHIVFPEPLTSHRFLAARKQGMIMLIPTKCTNQPTNLAFAKSCRSQTQVIHIASPLLCIFVKIMQIVDCRFSNAQKTFWYVMYSIAIILCHSKNAQKMVILSLPLFYRTFQDDIACCDRLRLGVRQSVQRGFGTSALSEWGATLRYNVFVDVCCIFFLNFIVGFR